MSRKRTYPLEKTSEPGVFKRGGRYVVVFRDPTGKQRKRFARTFQEARDLKADLRRSVRSGEWREAPRGEGFTDYARDWITTYVGRRDKEIREVTKDDYRRALGLDRHGEVTGKGACAFFGNRPLASIDRRDVEDYITTVRARGVTRNTIRLALAPVRCMVRDALERGDITRDPTLGVRLGGRRSVRSDETKDVLTPDELGLVLAAIPEDHRLFVRFLTVTGTRIGEAVAVQWRDLRDGGIRIERRWYRGMLDEPKTEAGTRTIPLRPEFVKALKKHRLASPHSRDTDFIFSSTEGGPLHASNFRRRILKPAFETAGIMLAPNLCFHVFRRSCGTWLGSHEGGNMDLPNLAAWLGHEDARVTLRHYLKPTGLEAPAALDALGEEPDVAHIVAHT